MPRLRQPGRLEDLALAGAVKFMRKVGENIMPLMSKSSKDDVHRTDRILREAVDLMSLLFEYNVPCYLFDRLCHEVFREIQEMVDYIKKTIDVRVNTSKFLTGVSVSVALSESVISRHLKSLIL